MVVDYLNFRRYNLKAERSAVREMVAIFPLLGGWEGFPQQVS